MSNYAVRGARDASGAPRDVFVANGRICAEAPAGASEIDASGLIVLPGFVDMHTHLREPGFEASETVASGTAAAAHGGFTAVCAMANLDPVTDSVERVQAIRRIAERDARADVLVVGSISKGLAGEELSPIDEMATAGVTMFSDDGRCVMNAALMRAACEASARTGTLIAQHSQDHDLAGATACADEATVAGTFDLPGWPWAAESIIIARDVQLAELTGARLHCCHVTTAESVEIVRWAKKRGINVTAEVTPHHLLLESQRLAGLDTTFKVNPPLRGGEDIEALRAGLEDGTIDVVGTDHAPHDSAAKNTAFPDAKPGMIGLEQALAAVMETMVAPGRMGWADVARVMSTAPATLARANGHGTRLAPGDPANLVLIDPVRRSVVDPEASWSKARNNPYAGMNLPDPIVMTMLHGRVTCDTR